MRPVRRASWPSALSSTVFSWTSSAARDQVPAGELDGAREARGARRRDDGGRRHAQRRQREHDEVRERAEDALADELSPRAAACGSGRARLDNASASSTGCPARISSRAASTLSQMFQSRKPRGRAVVVHVRDDALPVRLLPALDRSSAASRPRPPPRSRGRTCPSRRTAGGRTESPRPPCSRRRPCRACSRGPRARRGSGGRARRRGSCATSPAANTSSRPPARP